MGIVIDKSAALLLVLIFLTALSIIVAKPALYSDGVTANSWTAKAPVTRRMIGGRIA